MVVSSSCLPKSSTVVRPVGAVGRGTCRSLGAAFMMAYTASVGAGVTVTAADEKSFPARFSFGGLACLAISPPWANGLPRRAALSSGHRDGREGCG